jgi:zinc/manganese transport system permease protein
MFEGFADQLLRFLQFLQFAPLRNALITGSCVAIVAAIIGYFLIGRSLTFAGHALPNIGFAGAAGAVLLGVNPLFGLFAFTIAAGIGIGLLGRNARERDTAISVLMTFALGLGLLFLSLYSGYAERVYNILFGSVFRISVDNVWITAISGVVVLLMVLLLYRPLLFSTFDPGVAEARGVPVRAVAVLFMVLVAITVTIAIQVVGALLVFTLLVGPSATASRIARRPVWTILLAVLLGLGYSWAGILLATEDVGTWLGWFSPTISGYWPASFFIATLAFLVYLPVRLLSPLWSGYGERKPAIRQRHEALREISEPIAERELIAEKR